MRIVVTGGLGFIGAELALQFRRDGHSVVVVDSVESNSMEADEARAAGIEVVEQTVLSYLADCGAALDADLVAHAAGPVGAAGVLRRPDGIADGMVGTAAEVGRACLASGAGLVFISSSEVYGLDGQLTEAMRPQIPLEHSSRVEYALGKLTSEAVLAGLGRRGLRFVCLRPFNVVGARQSRLGGFVVPTFVQQALANLPITVFDDGQQSRSFIHVADLADFVSGYVDDELLEQRTCVNVGNPSTTCTILELAQRTKALLGSSSEISFVEGADVYGPGYVEAASRHKHCAIERASARGWRPRRPLDEIILDAAEHYRRHRDVRNSDVRDSSDRVGPRYRAAWG
jgi:nucleoside-diphosphate-sugar epimerase